MIHIVREGDQLLFLKKKTMKQKPVSYENFVLHYSGR